MKFCRLILVLGLEICLVHHLVIWLLLAHNICCELVQIVPEVVIVLSGFPFFLLKSERLGLLVEVAKEHI